MAKRSKKCVFTAAALLTMTIVLSGCGHTYDIKMNYRCVTLANFTVGLGCSEWEQEGGVQTPSCFPGEATVTTKNGPKTMAALKKGEEILGFDRASGRAVFSPVRAWLHRDPTEEVNMVAVKSGAGILVASNRHSLAVKSGNAYKFAAELEAGHDTLLTANGTDTLVEKVYEVYAKGLFAPLTETSNFFVGGHDGTPGILAHSFAQLQEPQRYEAAFHGSLSVAEFFWSSINEVNHGSDEPYVHPIARLWMDIAGIRTTQTFPTRAKRTYSLDPNLGFIDHDTIDADSLAEERRLGSGRRLYNNNGENNQDEQERILMYAAIQVLPPFIRHGIAPFGTPGFAEGPQNPPASNVEQWLDEALKENMTYAIVTWVVCLALFCCYLACALLGATVSDDKRSYDEFDSSSGVE
jgi:hypothetical protein